MPLQQQKLLSGIRTTGINDWTIVGIIHDDVVDASMRRIQSITIVLLLILNGCIALLLTGTVFA